MAKNKELQPLIDEIHLAFKESQKSDNLIKWDNFIIRVANKYFTQEQSRAFFEAQGALLSVFSDELIAFVLDYAEMKTEKGVKNGIIEN